MEDGLFSRKGLTKGAYRTRQTAAINDKYAAFLVEGEIYVQRLACLDKEPEHLRCPRASGWTRCSLALSHIRPNILAAALGSATYIFDLETCTLSLVLTGIGRTITSIEFSVHEAEILYTGHIDGSICVWETRDPKRLLQRISSPSGACHAIVASPVDQSILASIHNDTLQVWHLDESVRRWLWSDETTQFEAVAWRPKASGSLAAVTTDGELRLHDLSDFIVASHHAKSPDHDDTASDDARQNSSLLMNFTLESPLKSISWASDTIIVGLAINEQELSLIRIEDRLQQITKLWSCRFETRTIFVRLLQKNRAMILIGAGSHGIQQQILPESIADDVPVMHGSRVNASTNRARHANEVESMLLDPLQSQSAMEKRSQSPDMNPVDILKQRAEASAFERTSRQLQQKRRLTQRSSMSTVTARAALSNNQPPGHPIPPSDHPLITGFELPVAPVEDHVISPMPFLSPTIPSRKISPHDLSYFDSGLGRELQLPKPLDSSIHSAAVVTQNGHDSDDSDDETFVDDVHGRAAFLPGGINVPLPKACGALFAPTGQLLTFFPPKPRPVRTQEQLQEDKPQERREKGSKMAKLFPIFGNMQADKDGLFHDSNSDDSMSGNEEHEETEVEWVPKFTFQPASFPSQLSWQPREVLTDSFNRDSHSQYKIIVSVHDVGDVQALHPTQQDTALQYRLLCNKGESGAELCEHNACIADKAGSTELGDIWRLLAMLLEDHVPLELLSRSSVDDDILLIARRALLLNTGETSFDVAQRTRDSRLFAKIRWTNHPFGGPWLVRQILNWAESRADVQSLACFSSILLEAAVRAAVNLKNPTAEQSILTHLPTYSLDHFTDAKREITSYNKRRAIPTFRRRAATITSSHESPTKSNPSQSSTPHLDPSSTPPFSFPSLSRQSTRLTDSGSASPEYSRSSFSAAAKHYAQSLSDKLTSYGTSPPLRKINTTTSTQTELSTSFPGGSWPEKSVSFASTVSESLSGRGLYLSGSTGNDEENGYDSEKTIDDTVSPRIPQSSNGLVEVNMNNESLFPNAFGSAKVKLIADDLTERVVVWIQYYAELLRSWEMLEQAAEIEKVLGLTMGTMANSVSTDLEEQGVLPQAPPNRRKTACNICFTAAKGITQICPSCLHSSHISCLEDYVADLADDEFECPSGCGCLCSELPFVIRDPPNRSPERPTFKKKASFTDPRRWRAAVEGDSW